MCDGAARSSITFDFTTRAPMIVLWAATTVAMAAVWHTLSQDFGVPTAVAALVAIAQTLPVVAAVRWPLPAWTASCVVLVAAAALVWPAGTHGLWPDPNLYVHLAVMFIAGMRVDLAGLGMMWLVLVGLSAALVTTVSATPGTPGLADTAGLATVTIIGAAALRARDQTLHDLERERIRAATLDERSRIARELHDVIAHHMSVIAIQAEAAPLRVEDPPDALSGAFSVIRGNAVTGLAELRRVVGLLRGRDDDSVRPQPRLDDLGDLIANVRAAGVAIDASIEGTAQQLAPGVQLSAFRIVQEALNNVMHHAPHSSVRLTIVYTAESLELVIANEPSQSPAVRAGPGSGLVGMQERVGMLGGQLHAAPTPDGGFAVTAVLPTGDQSGT